MRVRRNPPATHNEPLRSHVTRVGFNLTIGRTHIAALVYLNESFQRGYMNAHKGAESHRRLFNLFATGMAGCQTRGLVVHHYDYDHRDEGLQWHYTITRAGQLIIELLRESGLYAEYAGALPVATQDEQEAS